MLGEHVAVREQYLPRTEVVDEPFDRGLVRGIAGVVLPGSARGA
jgi:hypothetical protein